ncbi:DUF3426 domain-containing protein [Telluria sp. B2]
MALATQCPHCGTMFRVASDQLKLRGGIVRCGACQEIFDGSATLVDLDAMPARAPVAPQPSSAPAAPALPSEPAVSSEPSPVPAAPVAEPPVAEPEPDPLPFTIVDGPADSADAAPDGAAPGTTDFDEQPVYTLDFDHTFDPFGILPKVDAKDEAVPAASAHEAPAAAAEPPVAEENEPLQPAPDAVEIAAVAAPVAEAAPEAPAPAASEPEPVAGEPPAAPVAAEAEAMPATAQDETATESSVAAHAATATEPVSAEPAAAEAVHAEPAPAAPAAPLRAAAQKPVRTPAATAPGRIEPSFGLPVDEELVAQPLPDHEPEPVSAAAVPRASDAPPLPMREAAASVINTHAPGVPSAPPVARTPAARRAEKAAARRSRLTPTKIDAPPKIRVPESDEPEFVRRGRQQEQSGRTRKIAMLAGSLVLLLVLVAQGAFTFRNALAARFPAAKPVLVSSCAVLGCRVELPAQIDNLVIETGELTTLGGGAYAFTTQLRNQGAVAQAWPSLELSLTDANDKPLVRRVFAPRDYLTAGMPATNGLAPRTEQAIKLHFRVDDLQPSGYHIAVFYP